MVDKLPAYEQMWYTTSDGEHCSALRKADTVHIQGDYRGVRQMPITQFLPEFVRDQAKKGSLQGPIEDMVVLGEKIDSKKL